MIGPEKSEARLSLWMTAHVSEVGMSELAQHVVRPYVGIASLCERHERAANSSLSLIGVVDRLSMTSSTGERAPRCLVLRVYNPEPCGEHTVVVKYQGSDRYTHTAAQLVRFDRQVVTVPFDLDFRVDTGDALTIDIYIDQELVSCLQLPIDREEVFFEEDPGA
jgi:hypothetical protein